MTTKLSEDYLTEHLHHQVEDEEASSCIHHPVEYRSRGNWYTDFDRFGCHNYQPTWSDGWITSTNMVLCHKETCS